MNEGQTLRNEDNAFLPLSSGQISLLCEFCQSHKALCQAAEKTLKQHTWVSSPLQVRPSLMFNCGILTHFTRNHWRNSPWSLASCSALASFIRSKPDMILSAPLIDG